MSYYTIEENRIIISGNLDSLHHEKYNCDIEYFEIEPQEIPNLVKIKTTIYNIDWSSDLFTDGKPCSGNHVIESDDRIMICNFEENSLYSPYFVFTAINGKKYYVQDIYLADFEIYRILNLTSEQLRRIWLKVETGQILNDFIEHEINRDTYDIDEEVTLSRITDVLPEGAIYIDDESFELLELGYYQEFLEELLEIDLIEEITKRYK